MDANGPWMLYTDDEEGNHRYMHGVFTGPFDRVALAHAHLATFSLMIKPLDIKDANRLPVVEEKVHVSLFPFNSLDDLGVILANRPVYFQDSNYYNSVVIRAKGRDYKEERQANLAWQAKRKLTDEEREAFEAQIRKEANLDV